MHVEPSFDQISSAENLLAAWQEFLVGKRGKQDVNDFSLHLMDNVLQLHRDLNALTYRHGEYYAFSISDPKPRNIHKATVRVGRVLHHIFSVTDGSMDFRLDFNTENQQWKLTEVSDGLTD